MVAFYGDGDSDSSVWLHRVMLINPSAGKYLVLGSVTENKVHMDILRIFYHQNVEDLLQDNGR